ncbi:MAG: hypothetical protein ACE3L7_19845 [Candidatus Pristimantibacillus sp.]
METGADIVCLDNDTLFDSRKFKQMGDFGKVMEDQFFKPAGICGRARTEKEPAATGGRDRSCPSGWRNVRKVKAGN